MDKKVLIDSLFKLSLKTCTNLYKRGVISLKALPKDIRSSINKTVFYQRWNNLLNDKDDEILQSLGFDNKIVIIQKSFRCTAVFFFHETPLRVQNIIIDPNDEDRNDFLSICRYDYKDIKLPNCNYILYMLKYHPEGADETLTYKGYMYLRVNKKSSNLIRLCLANYSSAMHYDNAKLCIKFMLHPVEYRSLNANIIYAILPVNNPNRLFYREVY